MECRPDRVPDAVVDENVDVFLMHRHFSSDAWLLVDDVVKQKSEKMTWTSHVIKFYIPKNRCCVIAVCFGFILAV